MIEVETNENEERPVPSKWRSALCKIVDAFKDGDFQINNPIAGVNSLSNRDAERIEKTVNYFGGELISLPEEAWETSVYRWMSDHWEVIIDLYTLRDGRCDLVMFVNVVEKDGRYEFSVDSVHVP